MYSLQSEGGVLPFCVEKQVIFLNPCHTWYDYFLSCVFLPFFVFIISYFAFYAFCTLFYSLFLFKECFK